MDGEADAGAPLRGGTSAVDLKFLQHLLQLS
jgi:hypothetical protein